jgi:hypothetical protein
MESLVVASFTHPLMRVPPAFLKPLFRKLMPTDVED